MNQSKNKSKVISTFSKGSDTYKAIHAMIEYGPLTTQEVKEIIGCYKPRIGNTLRQSPEIYFMGNTRHGVWYLEYQVQDAKERYYELCKEFEKRKEKHRRNQIINLPVNPDMPSILCVFKGRGDEHTSRDVFRNVGGNFIDVKSHLHSLSEDGILLVKGNRPKIYRINPEYVSICGDAAKEIFRGYQQ